MRSIPLEQLALGARVELCKSPCFCEGPGLGCHVYNDYENPSWPRIEALCEESRRITGMVAVLLRQGVPGKVGR